MSNDNDHSPQDFLDEVENARLKLGLGKKEDKIACIECEYMYFPDDLNQFWLCHNCVTKYIESAKPFPKKEDN